MSAMPARPLIYHITHVDNLPSIIQDGGLWSDAQMIEQGRLKAAIGMSKIRERRLALPVGCHPGDHVGDYVPFYFCPRSVMLYLIYRGNDPELAYKGGQGPIVHLEADVQDVVDWAGSAGVRWAFSLSNAGAYYTEFRKRLDHLHEIDWAAVDAINWSSAKEAKQAEFLVHEFFPWHLVQRIGVMTAAVQTQTLHALAGATHRPVVDVLRNWYY